MSDKENAVIVRENQPLNSSQVLAGLNVIRGVMKDCMVEGQDYGKVPGCGDKPGLFQPGAQKLSMMFQLNPEVLEEVISDYLNFNRGYRLIVRVTNGTKFADGVGECSTLESKYRYRDALRTCPKCNKPAIIKGKAEYGGGWICFGKKSGCGEKWADGTEQAKAFESAQVKIENENPPDCWNTVRKMAFKRAFVHAIINATNTSELWSQDLEDLAANGMTPETNSETPQSRFEEAGLSKPLQEDLSNGKWKNVRIPFGKNRDKQLGELSDKSLLWYIEQADVGKDTQLRLALDMAQKEMAEKELEDDNSEIPF